MIQWFYNNNNNNNNIIIIIIYINENNLNNNKNSVIKTLENISSLRDGPLEKLWGGRGIFKLQEFFSLSNSLYEFFLGHSVNIF